MHVLEAVADAGTWSLVGERVGATPSTVTRTVTRSDGVGIVGPATDDEPERSGPGRLDGADRIDRGGGDQAWGPAGGAAAGRAAAGGRCRRRLAGDEVQAGRVAGLVARRRRSSVGCIVWIRPSYAGE